MERLTKDELWTLERYSELRPKFRAKIIAHKLNRRVRLGANATLYFEDQLTIRYQVQEMLRIEKIFDADGINDELNAYNPLIPDGSNWKATFMLEYPDVEQRRQALAQLVEVERCVWVQTANQPRVWAIADEDLERSTDEKTSAVHFLRFELPLQFVSKVKSGADIGMGIEHVNFSHAIEAIAPNVRDSLRNDLD